MAHDLFQNFRTLFQAGSGLMEAVYEGPRRNPFETAQALPRPLIRHACPSLDWHNDGRICTIRGTLLASDQPLE